MSHSLGLIELPTLHSGLDLAAPARQCLQFSTDDVPPRDRLDYWRSAVLRRMEPASARGDGALFRGRMTRLPGEGKEMLEHASDAMRALRTPAHCRQDGCDDISFGLVVRGTSVHPEQGRVVRSGEINVIDCTRPVNMVLTRHQTISFVMRRSQVREAIGRDPAVLADLRLPRRGMAALLQSHMQAVMMQAPHLTPEQRTLALDIAADMACAAIQQALASTAVDVDSLSRGVHGAALALIARECGDPELTPLRVAAALGCSRAALYRVFAGAGAGAGMGTGIGTGAGTSVAALIWAARLERAQRMLVSPANAGVPINEIAFRSGFVDHPTFDRMFKRRYAMTPREARAQAAEAAPAIPLPA